MIVFTRYKQEYKFKQINIDDMSVYPSIHHCDQHISLQDFVERIVMQP